MHRLGAQQVPILIRLGRLSWLRAVWLAGALASADALELKVLPMTMSVDATERTPTGALFNRENGRLTGLALAAAVDIDTRFGRLKLGAGTQHADGLLSYVGASQFGLPVFTQTMFALSRRELSIDKVGVWGRHAAWQLGLGAASQHVDRNILASPFNLPLQERLKQTESGWKLGLSLRPRSLVEPSVGTMAKLMPQTVGVQASKWQARNSRLDVNAFGYIDRLSLYPSTSHHHQVQLHARWPVSERVHLHFARTRQIKWVGASESAETRVGGQPVASARYPGVRMVSGVAALGLGFNW